MLGQPKPSISPPFDMFREIEGIFKGLGSAAPLFDRCQVQDGKRSLVAHRSGLKSMKCSITIEPYLLGVRIQMELKSPRAKREQLRGKREEDCICIPACTCTRRPRINILVLLLASANFRWTRLNTVHWVHSVHPVHLPVCPYKSHSAETGCSFKR